MSTDERICSIALTRCTGIGPRSAKLLVEAAGSAVQVFALRQKLNQLKPDISRLVMKALDTPDVFRQAEAEMEFVEKNRLRCIPLTDAAYPSRLRQCVDAPTVLYYKGEADLNKLHVVSMVGTRRASTYGKEFCARFVEELAALVSDVLVVSGLAYGIDIHAHRAALAHRLPTIGVLAHGLDRIYPYVHRHTAIEMLAQGGLLTEFPHGTTPDRFNFVSRNRIVAGMSDATVVVESAERGGSLITTRLANDYNREVFAVPGRITDPGSAGCNHLIATNEATLLTDAAQLVKALGWNPEAARCEAVQRSLFPQLNADEELIVRILTAQGDLHVNTLSAEANLPINQLTSLLFEMEMKGVVKPLPGGVYHLL